MANASISGVKCPVCGEGVSVRANVDPGEPATGMSGPPEYSHPGSGPELHELEDIEFECECRDNIEANAPTLKTHKTKELRRSEYFPPVLDENGTRISFGHYLHWIAHEHVYDENHRPIEITTNPMLEVYDAAIEQQAYDGEIEIDEWEPYHPDW